MRDGLTVTAVGLAIGLGGSLIAARAIRTWLFGVGPNDPVTFLAVGLMLSVIAAVACYVPARRAMNVDPMGALRSD